MNTYFSGISAVAVGGSHAALGTVTAPTVTVTAQGNVVKVISAPQLQQHLHLHQHQPQVTKVANQLGSHGVPNTSISSSSSIKRSRISVMTKEKEVIKKPLYVTSSELMGACSALAKKEISLEADLMNMMHAFGDVCNPLDESIRLMESILKQELQGFVCVCDSIAVTCGSKFLGLLESITAIRNERPRLIRLLKYFAIKDQQQRMLRLNQIGQGVVPASKTYLEEIRSILEKLDEAGEFSRLLDPDFVIEMTKSERALRADKVYQRNNFPKFFTYSKARSVSFARKIGNLQDWVATNTRSESKMSCTFMEVMSFLSYEIVSQMVDMSFIVRREHFPSTNPIYRLTDTRVMNPETCMSSPAFQKRKDDHCNSVSEILVQASELEAKRLKKVSPNHKEIPLSKSMLALTPAEIGEAYARFQRCVPPAISYKTRAENLRRLGSQY